MPSGGWWCVDGPCGPLAGGTPALPRISGQSSRGRFDMGCENRRESGARRISIVERHTYFFLGGGGGGGGLALVVDLDGDTPPIAGPDSERLVGGRTGFSGMDLFLDSYPISPTVNLNSSWVEAVEEVVV